MNKTELVLTVSEKTGLQKKDAEAAVHAVFESIEGALVDGDKVSIIGFGNFEVRPTSERKARNPQTGAEIIVPAGKKPAFKAAKKLKEAVK
ncbi:HU family DNA-binding protein [Paenibacillus spiritus]|uniref:HU family DNA-binding protein n=1 Tax=Paenibacillus spiritus TaxID=2496557 RepID=A0A5J5GI43_9BACL|nr:HU family DNA-binding protein [Paenibacillus spiritus]KAA9007372.1 HU family DNA-binding protein [Paenibacillus spiritus]